MPAYEQRSHLMIVKLDVLVFPFFLSLLVEAAKGL